MASRPYHYSPTKGHEINPPKMISTRWSVHQSVALTNHVQDNYKLIVFQNESTDSMKKMRIGANKEKATHDFKIITVGDPGVGKTSIFRRFAQAKDVIDVEPTTTVTPGEYIRVVKNSETSSTMKLEMWDTAGCERVFSVLTQNYFRNVDAVLIVFDLSDESTFSHVRELWLEKLKSLIVEEDSPVYMLVGNKSDKERKVGINVAEELAHDEQLLYIETSTTDDVNVDEIFFSICHELLKRKKRHEVLRRKMKKNEENKRILDEHKPGGCSCYC